MKIEDVKKIAVFRALQIGDLLCSIPAIRALHHAYPAAEITLIGLPWAKTLVERFPDYIHSLIVFPGYPGFPEQAVDYLAFPDFLKQVQQENFDLALQMQGNGVISNPLVSLLAARHTAGFYAAGHYCPDQALFIEYPDNVHEIERHLQLVQALGISAYTTNLEFTINDSDMAASEAAALPVLPHKYVVIHPGARGANRQWSPANFARVADECIERDFEVVLTGTTEEAEIVESVIGSMQHKPINAIGRTSLGAVAVLIKNAAVLVSNCTGVSHIAAALQTKSIVISLDGEPFRWGPLNTSLHKTIDWTVSPDMENVLKNLHLLLSEEVNS